MGSSAVDQPQQLYLSSLALPDQLACVPHVCVGLVGLAPRAQPLHRLVSDAFTAARKSDRGAIHYSLIAADQQFPPAKPTRTTFEWFQPRGILKRRWMHKHLYDLPSVIVIFFDLEWSDPSWNDKKLECRARVQAIRAALTAHQTRLAVVLLQQAVCSDEQLATERYSDLCQVCDLSAKSLWVLPCADHLNQYALRLETAFYELSQTYYQQRVKRVRAHRELLNRSHHQALFVRHQFKLGFFSEVRQDTSAAFKAYQQAYTHLLELRAAVDWEILTVSACVSYKICRLAFGQNLPRDAIAHFRRHVETFRNVFSNGTVGAVGVQAGQHSAWMSQQYQWFGELFEQAVQMGLSAIQTQHPGMYFELAASHARSRRQLADSSKLDGLSYPQPDPLSGCLETEYYGQWPWRVATTPARTAGTSSAAGPPAAGTESVDELAGRAIQLMERLVNHHNIIIPLLGSAVSHYKKYHCPRTKARLMVRMADEYAVVGDHEKAGILLMKVLPIYQTEQWWSLAAHIAWTGLSSAYQGLQVVAYLTMCTALLDESIPLSDEDRARLDDNFHRITQRLAPSPERQCSSVDVEWTAALTAFSEPVHLELGALHGRDCAPLACRLAFQRARYRHAAPLHVRLQLRSRSAQPLHLRTARVSVVAPVTAGRAGASSAASLDLSEQRDDGPLLPGATRTLELVVAPPVSQEEAAVAAAAGAGVAVDPSSAAAVVRLDSCSVHLCPPDGLPVTFAWKLNSLTAEQSLLYRDVFGIATFSDDASDRQPAAELCAVIEPAPVCLRLRLVHRPPALVGEVYQLDLQLSALTDDLSAPPPLTDVTLEVGVASSGPVLDAATMEAAKFVMLVHDERADALTSSITISCADIAPGEDVHIPLALQCLTPHCPKLQVSVRYSQLSAAGVCPGRVTELLEVPVVQPFQVEVCAVNERLELVDAVAAGQTLFMFCEITSTTSSHQLQLYDTQLAMDEGVFEKRDGSITDPSELSVPQQLPSSSSAADGGTEQLRSSSSAADGGTEQLPSSSSAADGGTEQLPSASSAADGGTEQLPSSSSAADSGMVLRPGESASYCIPVTVRGAAAVLTSQSGSCTIVWNRLEEGSPAVSTVVSVPALRVRCCPLSVTLQLPAHGRLKRPLLATYRLQNRCRRMLTLAVHLDASEAFMFSGDKRLQCRLMPGERRRLQYNLYPVLSGRLALPRLRLSAVPLQSPAPAEPTSTADNADSIPADIQHALHLLPTHLYVLPEERGEGVDDYEVSEFSIEAS